MINSRIEILNPSSVARIQMKETFENFGRSLSEQANNIRDEDNIVIPESARGPGSFMSIRRNERPISVISSGNGRPASVISSGPGSVISSERESVISNVRPETVIQLNRQLDEIPRIGEASRIGQNNRDKILDLEAERRNARNMDNPWLKVQYYELDQKCGEPVSGNHLLTNTLTDP